MKNIRNALFLLIALLAFPSADATGCTSVVISGKATPDGRPLLWKNRDTDFLQNAVRYFPEGKFPFIGIVNSEVLHPGEVWMGTNSAGFSLMNTQSYNLVKMKPGEERGAANGRVMKRALEVCASVEDFRHFLDTIAKPSFIEANFGVIDANGEAGFFEVDYYHYTYFDANDSAVAPHGYIARTNFSVTGKEGDGLGFVRYVTEVKELESGLKQKSFMPEWIFNNLARCFKNEMIGTDLKDFTNHPAGNKEWAVNKDYISREETANSVVVQGVSKGEDPQFTTMWTVLGYPPTGVVLPLWVAGADELPQGVVRNSEGVAPFCRDAWILADKVMKYPENSSVRGYLHWKLLFNEGETGYMQQIEAAEKSVYDWEGQLMDEWRADGKIDVNQLHKFYKKLDDYVAGIYSHLK